MRDIRLHDGCCAPARQTKEIRNGVEALTGGDADGRARRNLSQQVDAIGRHRLFKPCRPVRFERARHLERRLDVEAAVPFDHQLRLLAGRDSHCFHQRDGARELFA